MYGLASSDESGTESGTKSGTDRHTHSGVYRVAPRSKNVEHQYILSIKTLVFSLQPPTVILVFSLVLYIKMR